jgi:hypothetical protein
MQVLKGESPSAQREVLDKVLSAMSVPWRFDCCMHIKCTTVVYGVVCSLMKQLISVNTQALQQPIMYWMS